MDKKAKEFPVKSKDYKVGDRIIYINKAKENLFLQKGKIVFKKKQENILIAEFDKNVRSKESFSQWTDVKMGFGAYVTVEDCRKIKKEDFDLEVYKERLAKLEKKKKAKDETSKVNNEIPEDKPPKKKRDKSKLPAEEKPPKKKREKSKLPTETNEDKPPKKKSEKKKKSELEIQEGLPKKEKSKRNNKIENDEPIRDVSIDKKPKKKKVTEKSIDTGSVQDKTIVTETSLPEQPSLSQLKSQEDKIVIDMPKPVQEDDPNVMKISILDYKKIEMKIDQLQTQNNAIQLNANVLQKEKTILEQNNKALKTMLEESKQTIQSMQQGKVLA
jgi:hypothetical protein